MRSLGLKPAARHPGVGTASYSSKEETDTCRSLDKACRLPPQPLYPSASTEPQTAFRGRAVHTHSAPALCLCFTELGA